MCKRVSHKNKAGGRMLKVIGYMVCKGLDGEAVSGEFTGRFADN